MKERLIHHTCREGHSKQDKPKFSGLGEEKRYTQRILFGMAKCQRKPEENDGLYGHETSHMAKYHKAIIYQQAKIYRHPDGHKKQRQEKVSKRFNDRFDLMTKF